MKKKSFRGLIFAVTAVLGFCCSVAYTRADTENETTGVQDFSNVTVSGDPSGSNGRGSATIGWNDFFTKQQEKTYTYLVYRGTSENGTFQSIGKGYDYRNEDVDNVNVLNIYPSNDIGGTYKNQPNHFKVRGSEYKYNGKNYPHSAALKSWMEEKDADIGDSAGRGIITVDPISYAEFNQDPEKYIRATWKGTETYKDRNGNARYRKEGRYQYDVIFIGTWDANAENTFTDGAIKALQEWLASGRGLISGHDTFFVTPYGYGQQYVSDAAASYTEKMRGKYNIKVYGYDADAQVQNWYSNNVRSRVVVTKEGLLTTYPWYIGEEGKILDVPETHTSGQIAYGDVWMELNNPDIRLNTDQIGNACFYLTTWNNTAMIQTGHSDCAAKPWEKKIIANLIFYMDQVIRDDHVIDNGAQDVAKPNLPSAANNEIEVADSGKNLYKLKEGNNEILLSARDNGSDYWYYVNARWEGNVVATSEKNKQHVTITTHTKSYRYLYDDNKNTTITAQNGMEVNSAAEGDAVIRDVDGAEDKALSIKNIVSQKKKYLHVAAIDGAQNIGPTITIELPDPSSDIVPYTVKYFFENKDDDGFTCDDSKTNHFYGETGVMVSADSPRFEGFEFDENNSNNVKSCELISGSSEDTQAPVLKLYYKRIRKSVKYEVKGAIPSGYIVPRNLAGVKYGTDVQIAENPSYEGYTFSGWSSQNAMIQNGSFIMPGNDVTITGTFNVKEDTPYKVEHYLEKLDGSYYLQDTENLTGTTNNTVRANPKSYSGFSYNNSKSFDSGIIAGDGTLVLRLYYVRNSYKVTYSYQNAPENAPALPEEQTVKFGTEALDVAETPSLDGYTFKGWDTSDVQTQNGKFTMPAGNVNFTGIWEKNAVVTPIPTEIPTPSPTPSVIPRPSGHYPSATSRTTNPSTPQLNTYDHYAYVIGYPDKSVHPSGEITRAETGAIFFRLLTPSVRDSEFAKVKQTDQAAVYDDVKKDSWYYSAVAVMKDLGIIHGYPDGSFKPNAPITRAEFAAIVERFNKNTSGEEITYSDIAGHWAEKDIRHAAADGWIYGYPDGTFKPNNKITRAEAMAIVNRVLKRYPDSAYVFGLQNDPELHVWTDNSDRNRWYYLDVQEATNSHKYHRTGTARVTNERKYDYNTEWWDDATKAPNWERYQSVN